ncbi:Cell cycle switch protein CCS52a [Heracleum sosnowskyi]|uniref:Cell cycle switch protein CCS52a n=1 Tax=Heracleum sosnowskyi TaxID=360622 RepID=A0AAD8MFS3_9APIA|nr:Cell cycle switch protein CCS52a [Heracleum sosnowskyi]
MNLTTSNAVCPYNKPSHSRTIYSDRFIPSRTCSNFSLFNLSTPKSDYATRIRTALFGPESSSVTGRNIFKFKSETKQPLHSLLDDHLNGVIQSPVKPLRTFPKSPCKILDAPGLEDDFYSNLVDWSSQNILVVGLGNCVYTRNGFTSKVTKLCDLGENDSVCSVGWDPCGTNLAVGTRKGKVQIWDASQCKRIRTMDGHEKRVGALAWAKSQLSSGRNDGSILQHDIRAQENHVSKLSGHKSEVCALKWSYNDRELASGGNDNRIYVWNQHSTQPVMKYCEHTAAVKAIAWSPHLYGLLASGGGTADKCIRFWNTTTNSHLRCINTGSQVCNLIWSKNVNELVSTHGYHQNHILVWRYSTMSKLATLEGHKTRVLYLAISPDGKTIVTGAGDETLRFWNVFPSPKSQNTQTEFGVSVSGRTQIR